MSFFKTLIVGKYIYIYLVAQTIVPHNSCVPSRFPGVFLETYILGMYIEIFFKKMMQTHPSMLEYASAGPCTLHPMRFPEATFFFSYLSIYLSFIIYVQYIYTHTDGLKLRMLRSFPESSLQTVRMLHDAPSVISVYLYLSQSKHFGSAF